MYGLTIENVLKFVYEIPDTQNAFSGRQAGNVIPPMHIFRRILMNIELMDGTPPGLVYMYTICLAG